MSRIRRKFSLYKSNKYVLFACGFSFVFLVILAMNQVADLARERIIEAIDGVDEKVGLSISVGDVRIGFGEASIDDVVVGDGSMAVVSTVRASVHLNPFDENFGQLRSVSIEKVRFKGTLEDIKNAFNRTDGESDLEETEQIVALPGKLTKLFDGLPITESLRIKSGGFVLTDSDGELLVAVKRGRLLMNKKTKKILFRVGNIVTRGGYRDSNLRGKLAAASRGAYKFIVRKPKSKTEAGWKVIGSVDKNLSTLRTRFSVPRIPEFVMNYLRPYVKDGAKMGVKGFAQIAKSDDGAFGFKTNFESGGVEVDYKFLSSNTVLPVKIVVTAIGHWTPKYNMLKFDDLTLTLPPTIKDRHPKNENVQVKISASLRLPSDDNDFVFARAYVSLQETSCQSIIDAAPRGFLPTVEGFEVDGRVSVGGELTFTSRNPEDYVFRKQESTFTCRVVDAPYSYSAKHLAGPFTLERNDVGMTYALRIVPDDPSFTQLRYISSYVNHAFITAEDSSFWRHEGIVPSAIESALRRNLAESKVAVGGSTITMQTVKNLFLSHERTLSRKMQEMFLTWHLENALTKQRIFEIYLNIVEFGPNIFGITQAARYYFDKHPSRLNASEAAFLALLLPSPKKRHRQFCFDKFTPGFNGLYENLLNRMLRLNRIDYDSYLNAMTEPVAFNASKRQSSSECMRTVERAFPELGNSAINL